jgi:hypothetical protein
MTLLMQFLAAVGLFCAVLTSDGFKSAGNAYFPARSALSKNEAKNLKAIPDREKTTTKSYSPLPAFASRPV